LPQVCLLLPLLPPTLRQPLLLQHPSDRRLTRLEIEHHLQPPRPITRDRLTRRYNPALLGRGRLVRNPFRRTTSFLQPLGSLGFEAPKPQTNRVPTAPKHNSGTPDPVLLRMTHHLKPKLEPALFHFSA